MRLTRKLAPERSSPTVLTSPDFTDEKLLLKPRDKGSDPDDWECFVLNDTTVYSRDGSKMASLIQAELEGPLIVQGTLKLTSKAQKSKQLLAGNTQRLQLDNVIGFSMSPSVSEDSNEPILWAAGQAGWFEIKPAKGYSRIYDEMMEGISLYFFFVDLYEEAPKKLGSKRGDMKSLYKLYAETFNLPNVDEEEISKVFLKHASFLISQMRKDTQFVSWKKKAIFEYLVYHCQDIYQQYLENDQADVKAGRRIIDFQIVDEKANALSETSQRTKTELKPKKTKEVPAPVRNRGRAKDSRGRSSTSVEELSSSTLNPNPSTVDEVSSQSSVHLQPLVSTPPRSTRSGKVAGKNAGLRPTPLRRQLSPDYDDDDIDSSFAHKRPRLSPSIDRSGPHAPDLEDAEDSEDSEDSEEDENTYNDYRDAAHADEVVLEKVNLSVVTEALPSTRANGPRGLWRCEEPGCDYENPGAEKAKGKAAIQLHFLEHADEFAYKEHLVITMGQRECHPVSHLLERIREMGAQAKAKQEAERKVIDGRVVPLPIKKKLSP